MNFFHLWLLSASVAYALLFLAFLVRPGATFEWIKFAVGAVFLALPFTVGLYFSLDAVRNCVAR